MERKFKKFLAQGGKTLDEKPLEEKIIILDKIDYTKGNAPEAIGIPEEEIENCKKKLRADYKFPRALLDRLGLTDDELCQAVDELLAADKVVITKSPTKIIANLWKRKGKKEITLTEFVGSQILIAEALVVLQEKGEIDIKIVVGSKERNSTIYV